jgi:transposase
MVTDQKGIPLSIRALDGNSSDKKAIIKTKKELIQNLNLDDRVYHVADFAFYTENNVKEIGNSAFSFQEFLQSSMKQRNYYPLI